MPDTAPPAAPAEHRFPCTQCGADMRYSPAERTLVCDHCGNTAPVVDPGPWAPVIAELDFQKGLDAALPGIEMEQVRHLKCPNCGAEFDMGPDEHATECPFCATPVVTDTGLQRRIKPKGVLPFALEERRAHKAMNDWLGRLWFAPNGLKEYARRGRRMDGIYVPYWTFDADTRSSYKGQRGRVHYETRRVIRDGKAQTVRVPKVHWTPVSGRVARFFDDVLVLASTSLPKTYTDGLQPWDLSEMEPYRPEYLAGFRAEGYTVPLDQGFREARAYMDRVIRRDVRFDIGGDQQQITSLDTTISAVTFKHILLPVWLAAYKYRGRTYRFVINGRTGRVQGERPWSTWKIAVAVILGLILAAGVGYVVATNQQQTGYVIELR